SYLKTTSNIIETGNLNIYTLKDRIRKRIHEEIGVLYPIHSTNGIHEFCFQMPLLLGPALFIDLLNGIRPSIKRITKDLEGADGWPDWGAAFEVLNLTSNYLLLNSSKGLPDENWNKNPVFLTDNYQQLASALNVSQLSTDGSKGSVRVNGRLIPVTIRFIGDKYRSTAWQKDMLQHKVCENGI